MINIFHFASDDKSLYYLAQIFGYMNGVIPIPSTSGPQPSGTSVSILGTMFMTFNSIILVIGTLLVVYTTVVGLLMTAHEGEFMKKWNSLWTPLRTVLGIAALVPSGSGYSGIQMIMMWVIVQGIGAADSLWSTALNYVQVMGSVQSQLSLPGVSAYQTMTQLFQGLVCDASAHISKADPLATTSYYCNSNPGASTTGTTTNSFACSGETISQFDSTKSGFSLGNGGACGILGYCDTDTQCADGEDTIKCVACRAQHKALSTVVTNLSAIAITVASDDYYYRDWYARSQVTLANSNWQMIADYCKAQGIETDKCCIPSSTVFGPLAYSPCKADSTNNPFPAVSDAGGYGASDELMNSIIWPYSIKSTYGGDNFISTATNEYMNQLSLAVNDYITKQAKKNDQSALSGQLADAEKTGWLLAGSYYYTVASVNNNNLKDAIPTFSMTSQPPGGETTTTMSTYRNNVSAASKLVSAASGAGLAGSSSLSSLAGPGYEAGSSVSAAFQQTIDSNDNPLATVATLGYTLLMIAYIAFVVVLAVTIALGFLGNIDVEVLGSGVLDPLGPALMLVYLVLMPVLMFIFGILITYGGLLGVYVPLIPYIVFTVGSVGWFISTLEAMIAGPIVALGIIAPGGQHEVLGHAHHGILMLLNIFLRPSLMIFGLIAAMLLAGAMVELVNSAFVSVMIQVMSMVGTAAGTNGDNSTTAKAAEAAAAFTANPLELFFFIGAYITLLVTVLNKCFAAIYILPQQVIQWIGGHAGASMGEEQALGEAKHGIEATGQGAKQAGKGIADTGKQANEQRASKQAKEHEKTKDDKKTGGGVDIEGKK